MIYKYELEIGKSIYLELPTGSVARYIGEQHGEPYIWIEMGKGDLVSYIFETVGTGWENLYTNYIGTVQIGQFVWHVYQK